MPHRDTMQGLTIMLWAVNGLARRSFLRILAGLGAGAATLTLAGACGFVPGVVLPTVRIRRIGYLSAFTRDGSLSQAFVQGLHGLGYTEGENYSIEWRFADGSTQRLDELAAELIERQVEVIATESTPALVAAAQASHGIPVVSGGPNRDLVDLGLAQSYARPGGNVTGTGANYEQYGKLVDLLKETVPQLVRVGYLRNPTTAGTAQQMALSQEVAQKLGLQFVELQASTPDEIDAAFAKAASEGAEALVISADTLIGDASGYRAVSLALQYRLPTIYSQTGAYVKRGAMMGYGPDFAASQRRAAVYVDKILRGASPADLPIEQAMTLDLAVNLSTARALGVTIPKDVAVQVTQWIE